MALMLFDSIILNNCYEGLFLPGLRTPRYATCGQALMDFLPCLIPGTLSSRINATLAAVRCETMSGYDYLWRVLELYVLGFDPVVAIQMSQWADSKDIFHFAQTYLRSFSCKVKCITTIPIALAAASSFVPSSTPTTPIRLLPCSPMSILTEKSMILDSYRPISVCTVWLKASTRMHKVDFGILSLCESAGWTSVVLASRASRTPLWLIVLVGRTIPTIPTVDTPVVIGGAHHRLMIMLVDTTHVPLNVLANNVAFPALTATGARSSRMFNVRHANGLVTLQSTVTCSLQQFALNGT